MEQTKTGPRDVFFHLLAIIGLYAVVLAFGGVLFQLINIGFPDALAGPVGRYAREGLKWPLAVAVVMFPFYVWITSYIEKDLVRHPEKRALRTRKWLIYFTLFIATLVIIGDLISLIFHFLEGGLSVQFGLKVLSVFAIAGSVFLYYGWNLKRDAASHAYPRMKFFMRGIVGVVGIIIIGGFFVAGSPQSERLLQFDDMRVGSLQSIQSELVSYWQSKQKLPASLDALNDPLRGFTVPVDPTTNAAYEYRATGPRSFELCGTFETSNEGDLSRQAYPADPFFGGSFTHGTGRVCFPRTIDPDRFPPLKK